MYPVPVATRDDPRMRLQTYVAEISFEWCLGFPQELSLISIHSGVTAPLHQIEPVEVVLDHRLGRVQ